MMGFGSSEVGVFAFTVPVRVLSRENMTGDNASFKNWYLSGENCFKPHPQTRIWIPLKIFEDPSYPPSASPLQQLKQAGNIHVRKLKAMNNALHNITQYARINVCL